MGPRRLRQLIWRAGSGLLGVIGPLTANWAASRPSSLI